jgi:hypothetical protein
MQHRAHAMTIDDRKTIARDSVWARPLSVAAIYAAAAVAMTWPIISVIHREIAGDLGDTLFNAWVLLWTSGQVLRTLTGDLSALADYWNGNIFYPSPLTLGYSEHLTPQMLQVLPVFALTQNVVLCYNLVWFSTVVLSGLGMYLLVRELTGHPLAAFLAGLAFAFAPYRIDQYAHIEVLSSQWMPFALYGFRRYFDSGRLRPLLGGASALLVQGLSCGYYLAYFTPFAVVYCLYELIARGRLRDLRAWRDLVVAGAVVLAIVAVFLLPYARVRAMGDIGVRHQREVREFSADTYAYATSAQTAALWGEWIHALPRDQQHGFPGFASPAFAAIAVLAGFLRIRAGLREESWRRFVAPLVAAAAVVQVLLVARLLVFGPVDLAIGGFVIQQRTLKGILGPLVFTVAMLMLASPRWRQTAREGLRGPIAFFAMATVAAVLLSFGPVVYVNRHPIGAGPYGLLYHWVPGFNGLRVVSMYFMLVACFLSVLAGFGAARLGRSRAATLVMAAGMMLILAEGRMVAYNTNAPPPTENDGLRLRLRLVYRLVASLPKDCVLVEFPLGDIFKEIQYTYAAGYHRRPIVNGYSGFFPLPYRKLRFALENPVEPEMRWSALLASGATYAVVHEGDFRDSGEGRRVSDWLRDNGSREVATVMDHHVFLLPPRGARPDGH